jgi:ABC-type lipoprotein release transport system permease subunit
MIGRGLADILKTKVGDEIVFISQGADGSIANDIFTVSAILSAGTMASERMNAYMHIQDAQEFLSLQNRYHEVVILLGDYSESIETAKKISEKLNDPALDVQPWEVVQRTFYESMLADKNGMWVSLLIIMIIVGLGVLNTVLMTILERTREYGIMKAIGTKPFDIVKVVVYETVFLSLLSNVVGLIFSLILNYFFTKYGIDYPEPFNVGGILVTTMYGVINVRSFLIPFLTVFLSSVSVSIIPAIRAGRIKPVDAVRMD